jgi:hypothetical protein
MSDRELATDETLGIEHTSKEIVTTSIGYDDRESNPRVGWVHRDLIFCGIADETLGIRKGDVRPVP